MYLYSWWDINTENQHVPKMYTRSRLLKGEKEKTSSPRNYRESRSRYNSTIPYLSGSRYHFNYSVNTCDRRKNPSFIAFRIVLMDRYILTRLWRLDHYNSSHTHTYRHEHNTRKLLTRWFFTLPSVKSHFLGHRRVWALCRDCDTFAGH